MLKIIIKLQTTKAIYFMFLISYDVTLKKTTTLNSQNILL